MENICNNWCQKDYSYINFAPDDSVSEENRAWQGCPSVAVTKKGRVFAGWYSGGAFEPCITNYNILTFSDDAGQSWAKPILTVGTDTKNRLRKIDIELWVTPDNSLWVMWTVSPYSENSTLATIRTPFKCDYHREFPCSEVMVCRDPDADVLVWEKPRIMCEGFIRNKPIVTSGGRIIAPAYAYSDEKYMVRCSDDNGYSFYNVSADGKPDVKIYDEITVCELKTGKLRFLARTSRGYYAYCDSFDDGLSWTEAKEYEKAPASRCYFGKLKNGMIAYVRNVSDTGRVGMKICLSEDGGVTFPYEMIIDERKSVSYPDLDEDGIGNLYVIYDRERDNRTNLNTETFVSGAAKEILLCKVKVTDVINKSLSEGSFVQKIVSKGRMDYGER